MEFAHKIMGVMPLLHIIVSIQSIQLHFSKHWAACSDQHVKNVIPMVVSHLVVNVAVWLPLYCRCI
jgi:hypothetical protein